MNYQDILKNRLEKLQKPLKDFILNDSWRNKLKEICLKFNLEDKTNIIENEMVLVFMCFEPKENIIQNLKNEFDLDQNIGDWLFEELNKEIFAKIDKEIEIFVNSELQKKESGKVDFDNKNSVVNQIMAMQPAQDKTGVVNQSNNWAPPENLPTEEFSNRKIHDYPKGVDPYREPAE